MNQRKSLFGVSLKTETKDKKRNGQLDDSKTKVNSDEPKHQVPKKSTILLKSASSHSQTSLNRRNNSRMSLNNFYTQKNSIFDNHYNTTNDVNIEQSKHVIQTSDVNITDSDLDISVSKLQQDGQKDIFVTSSNQN